MDVVLGDVQPEEIAFEQAGAPVAGKDRIAVSVELLFREHYARIVGMLARLTGDRAHSEEIASDVFHKLSQRPARWAIGVSPPWWRRYSGSITAASWVCWRG